VAPGGKDMFVGVGLDALCPPDLTWRGGMNNNPKIIAETRHTTAGTATRSLRGAFRVSSSLEVAAARICA
jgi:hypothetical protein